VLAPPLDSEGALYMPTIALRDMQTASFRANPNYEVVLFDHLPPDQQAPFNDLRQDPRFYGILRPHGCASLAVQAVDQETALLLFALQAPSRAPAYVMARLGEAWNQSFAELVLDGVLEIEHEGTFVSGVAARAALFFDAFEPASRGRIAELSLEALRYAQDLPVQDPARLARQLYLYNHLPLTPAWKRRLPAPDAVASYLGIGPGGACRLLLERHWSQNPPSPTNDGWFSWRTRRELRWGSRQTDLTYKLYVSPLVESVPQALRALLEASAALPAFDFKIGCDMHGLLRPDKLVVYFPGFEELAEAADVLAGKLEGCPAHGVPFTAGITADGLLSWGIDPPLAARTRLRLAGESWRGWITSHLARSLASARGSASSIEPWQFALERLRLDGVDTDTWVPPGNMWQKCIGQRE